MKRMKNLDCKNGYNVLSLFDGISCARLALEQLNIKIQNYFTCEIDILTGVKHGLIKRNN